MPDKKRILILGKKNTVFILQTARDFNSFGYEVTLLGNEETYSLLNNPAIKVLNLKNIKAGVWKRAFRKAIIKSI